MLINLFDVAVCWLVVANYIISYLYRARKRYRRGKGGERGGGAVLVAMVVTSLTALPASSFVTWNDRIINYPLKSIQLSNYELKRC